MSRPRKRDRASQGLNLRMSGRLARPAPSDTGPTAADLDRLVRAWRVGLVLDRLHRSGPLTTPASVEPATRAIPAALTGGVRKVSRGAAGRVWNRATGTRVVLDVLAGRERRIDAPPQEIADLGLDVCAPDVDIELLELVFELKRLPRRSAKTAGPGASGTDLTLPRTMLVGTPRRVGRRQATDRWDPIERRRRWAWQQQG